MCSDFLIDGRSFSGTAVTLFSLDDRREGIKTHKISEHRESYWVSNLILDLGGKIPKDSDEGRELKRMIKDESIPFSEIQDFLDRLALRLTPLEIIKAKLEHLWWKSVRFGEIQRLEKIWDALNPSFFTP